ncbi:MAG: hypothetical protein ABII22_02065 [Candidatus Micrarchaeota archaeon]
MTTKDEIEKVIQWCEDKKREKKRLYVIERNPFRDEISFMRRFPLIEIDRPKEVASKYNLVYDSTIRALWENYMGEWRKINPSVEIKIE